MQPTKFHARALALILSVIIAQPVGLFAAQGTPQLPDPGSPGMNKQQQQQLGQQVKAEVYKQMPVLPDSNAVTQYVQQLGRKLVATVPADRSWPYEFHVVQAKDINAFALPGGPIFINVGTIQAAANEAELAGVMSHEMSHVYMQHTAKQAPKANMAQIIAGLAGAVLPQSGIGNLARLGIQFGAGSMLMKYSRKDEAQADAVGAIIMYRAGYNPKAMADFFSTLEKKYGSGGLQILSDHPNPGNRQQAVEQEIASWPQKNFSADSNQFASAKNGAGRIKSYSAQEIDQGAKQGTWVQQNRQNGSLPPNMPATNGANGNNSGQVSNVSLDQVMPSGNFKQLQQGTFSISYPENWQAGGDQNSIVIGPQQGVSQAGISYGTIINPAQQSNAGSLDEATQQLLQGLQQQNPGSQISESPRSISVNGVQGRSAFMTGNSPVQENGSPLKERDWIVTLPSAQGGLMSLVFVAPERDFTKLRPTYEKMLDSLQVR